MSMKFRKLHRKVAPILFLPLLATTLTGVAYRLGRSWFGMPKNVAEFFLTIHQGEYLGQPLVPIYVLLVGLGLLGMVVTGVTMLRRRGNSSQRKSAQLSMRTFHRILAPIFFLPLAVSSLTGVIYALGERWFGLSDEQIEIFLDIHQGSYLGSFFKSIYVLFVGLGLVALLITGIQITGIFRKRKSQTVEDSLQ